jgi:hypothetical protein
MLKKISIALELGVLLSILAPAQTAPPTFAELLGTLAGTANFCAKVNPKSAAKYKELGQLVTNGHSEELIAEIRESKEYKDVLDQISKKLGVLSPKEALATCKVQGK